MAEGSGPTPTCTEASLGPLQGVGSGLDMWAQVDGGRSELLLLTGDHLS